MYTVARLLPGAIWNLPFWQCLYIPFEALTAIRMAANRRACVFGCFSVVELITVFTCEGQIFKFIFLYYTRYNQQY